MGAEAGMLQQESLGSPLRVLNSRAAPLIPQLLLYLVLKFPFAPLDTQIKSAPWAGRHPWLCV